MTQRACEFLWCRRLGNSRNGPIRLYCDNKFTVSIAHNLVQYDKIKHIKVDRYFIEGKLDSGFICTLYMSTTSMNQP